ncbi:hypothetical protein Tco_1576993 [Tanacetum coccineum]
MLAWPTSPFLLLPGRFSGDLPDLHFRCKDISKITRKQSKTGKHGHENQKSSKRSQRFKAEARKVKPQSNPVKDGQ